MMEPKVRQMIVCEDVRTRSGSPGKIDVLGIMNRVTAKGFPARHTFAVYLCLTNARGAGRGRIVVKKLPQGDEVYVGDLHPFTFGADPLLLHPFTIRVFSCPLPEAGLYSVEFEYNDVVLGSCELLSEKST